MPNSKINIGLNILDKRVDGFHNLQSVFYPIQLADVLELTISEKNKFNITGINLPIDKNNLVLKAYNLLSQKYNLPNLDIHLHKLIPIEAGLGGGSADAAYMLLLLNKKFNLNITISNLKKYADVIGSDCSFFIENKPSLVTGKGEVHNYLPNFLKGKYLVIIKPNISISTKEAFSNINKLKSNSNIEDIVNTPINKWKKIVSNDFEEFAFKKYPELMEIKEYLYKNGAEYSSMSGSGSAIYGIFNINPNITNYKKYFVWNEVMV